jgi:lipopolysaccharide export system permease protein
MIFTSAARREFAQAASGISVALLAILTSTQLIRLLNDAVGGRLAPEAVLTMLGFTALNFMPILLGLTLFMSVLVTMSRSYRDSEMVVWFISGQSLLSWVSPVLRFAWPLIIAIALLSTYLTPWANRSSAEYTERLGTRNDASQLAPGAFKESQTGGRVFFVENYNENTQEVRNVFVTNTVNGKTGVMFASRGHQEDNADGRFMVMEKGLRYEVEPGYAELKFMNFDAYSVFLQDTLAKPVEAIPNRLPFEDLISANTARSNAEILWRISQPISALILVLMAIPLSFINPRAGRSMNLVLAILIYAIYNNLITVCQAWVSQGKLSFTVGCLAPHAVMLVPLIGMTYWRMTSSKPVFWRRWR